MSNRFPNPMDDDPMDSLLDRALATYAPTARAGLEDRIRARIATEPSPAPRPAAHSWRWIWAAGLAVAAAILLLAVVLRIHPRSTPNLPTTAHTLPEHPVPQPPQVSPQPVAVHNTVKPPISPHRRQENKPEVLPRGPSQEELIAELMAKSPGAVALMARAHQPPGLDPDKPIEIRPLPDDSIVIAPIEIKPLQDSSAESGGKF